MGTDSAFVEAIVDKVSKEFCIDLGRIYAQGESNGGMLVHALVQELPHLFAAVAPWYGTPLIGYAWHVLGNEALARTALLALHGRSDVTVPADGGVSEDGWLYISL